MFVWYFRDCYFLCIASFHYFARVRDILQQLHRFLVQHLGCGLKLRAQQWQVCILVHQQLNLTELYLLSGILQMILLILYFKILILEQFLLLDPFLASIYRVLERNHIRSLQFVLVQHLLFGSE